MERHVDYAEPILDTFPSATGCSIPSCIGQGESWHWKSACPIIR
ncbi:MAG: hypothetical protein NZ481_05190 [Candidatus Kapabacteria bacterium]|nr:hypothetical protein [Candidatus Kapabacteria bacterium]